MKRVGSRDVSLLAGALVGVYVLLIAGATAAITDAARACSTWPTCGGRWLVPPSDLQLAVAWGHRATAILVGLLVLVAVAVAYRRTEQRRVKGTLGVTVALYPVQIGLGALTVTQRTPWMLSTAHLVVGVAIFAGLVLALVWTLDRRTNTDEHDRPSDSVPDVEPVPTEAATKPSSDDGWEPPQTVTGRIRATIAAYGTLMKPRLMWLLCLVAAAGMGLAAGPDLSVRTVVATMTGGVLAIGASGTFNHVLERDVDRRMQRTADRPIATDRVGPRRALAFGILLTLASLAVFLTINLLAAALGLVAILFYSVIYTLVLKPNTVQNTVIGGFAGSLPAMIGAAAATETVGPAAWVLAGVIFLWTPAHFYNLALAYREDYARGGFPMLPVVRGEAVARKHILLYAGATFVAAALLSAVGGLGPLYAATAVVFGAVFLWAVLDLYEHRSKRAAMRSFHASNAYLGALLLAVILDTLAI